MHRPARHAPASAPCTGQRAICIFEAPEFGLSVTYETANFAASLKHFIDTQISPRVANAGGTASGTIDLLLFDPDWKDGMHA